MKKSSWPSYCPQPMDISYGELWEDLVKDAALRPERSAPQALLKPPNSRKKNLQAVQTVQIDTTPDDLPIYVRKKQLHGETTDCKKNSRKQITRRKPKPWVISMLAQRGFR